MSIPNQTLLKFLLFFTMVFALGLPLNTAPKLFLVVMFSTGLFVGTLKLWRGVLSVLVFFAVVWGIQNFWPRLNIEEGHHVFLPMGEDSYIKRSLPDWEYANLSKHYWSYQQCKDGQSMPTKLTPPNKEEVAFSVDSIWGQTPKYSRLAQHINFKDAQDLRIGEVGRKKYNFHSAKSCLNRKNLPYFVFYEVNEKMVGATLHNKGFVYLGKEGDFKKVGTKITLDSTHVGQKILGVFVTPRLPLSMQLETPKNFWFNSMRDLCIVLCFLAALLLGFQKFHWRDFTIAGPSLFAVFLGCMIFEPYLLTGYPLLPGGGDGLTYTGFGKTLLPLLQQGEWLAFFKGTEPIYYYMPGMGYFRALEQLFFGETHYGYVLILCLIPFVTYRFLLILFPKKWAMILWGIFLLTPIFERFGFAFYHSVKLVKKGFGEPMGYTLFLWGLTLLLPRLYTVQKYESHSWTFFLAGLSFAGSIFFRPNLALLVLLFSAFAAWELLGIKRWGHLVAYSFGTAMTLLIPFHNWYFGGKLVLLTSSAAIDNNMHVSPLIYGKALMDLFSGQLQGIHFQRVWTHLEHWNHLCDIYRLLPLGFVFWRAFSKGTKPHVRCLGWLAITAQGILWFYVPGGRYSYLAWMLTLLVALEWFPSKRQFSKP